MRPFVILLLTTLIFNSYSQGCSDAGFCTMGAMRPDQNYSKRVNLKLRSLEVNFYRGTSLVTPVIYAATVDFNVAINDRNSLQIKLPYMYIEGSLGENHGVGDISLSYTKNIKTSGRWSVNGTIGAKIPTNDANAKVTSEFTNNAPAPLHMYYQTSLGSFDAIAGVSIINEKWLLATGIQAALTENGNEFRWAGFPSFPDQEYVRKYDPGVHLKRGTDIMFRVERSFKFTNFNFTLGALPIYRITKDNVLHINDEGVETRVDLEGTTGLALSVIGSFGYHFNVKNSIKIIQGVKLTDRPVNPDGLTRNEVTSVSYIYKF
ncbi:MAG: hypothetical protein AAGA66_09105 [Bacteroidota bacterium]